jgi:hypothetical protein
MRYVLPCAAMLTACAGMIPDVTVDARVSSPLEAPDGRALIVFYEPKGLGFRGNVMDTSGRYVTSVAVGTYVPISVPPGQYDFVVFGGPREVRPLRATVIAGQIAVVEILIEPGFWAPNMSVNAHGSISALNDLQATLPVDTFRAEMVLHDTWNVSSVVERATERYSHMTDAERAVCTITP